MCDRGQSRKLLEFQEITYPTEIGGWNWKTAKAKKIWENTFHLISQQIFIMNKVLRKV